jgi:transcriptional regulator with XRE-family HTH domain
MITSNQLRAARALLNIDQRETGELADLSVPTIQRMEASDGVIRGNVDSLMKLVAAFDSAIDLINPGSTSVTGGRGVRLKENTAKRRSFAVDNQSRRRLRKGGWPRLAKCRAIRKGQERRGR